MADANKHASVNSSSIEELLVRMAQFLPRSYTSREGYKAMSRRVTAMTSDPIVDEIVGLMVAKITDDQKALLIAASARASDQVLASGDALLEAAKTAGLSVAQVAAGVKASVMERPLPTALIPLQAQITAYIQTLKGFQLTSKSGRALHALGPSLVGTTMELVGAYSAQPLHFDAPPNPIESASHKQRFWPSACAPRAQQLWPPNSFTLAPPPID